MQVAIKHISKFLFANKCGFLSLTIFCLRTATAQNYSFHHLNTSNGLASNITWQIAQDSSGFIWISGNNGLQRYDGKNFITYRHDPSNRNSISSGLTGHVLVDHYDYVWVVTVPTSILRLDYTRKNFRPVEFNADSIKYISLSPEKEIWATGDRSIYRYDYTLGKFVAEATLPAGVSSNINTKPVFDARSGIAWMGVVKGMYGFDLKTKTLFPCNTVNDRFFINTDQGNVQTLSMDESGKLWISTYNPSLLCFDPFTKTLQSFDEEKIKDDAGLRNIPHLFFNGFLKGDENNFWISSENGGLLLYDSKHDQFKSYQYSAANPLSVQYDRSLHGIYKDRDGNLWVTSDKGVTCFNPSHSLFTNYVNDARDPKSFPNASVNAILKTKKKEFWFATFNGGLVHCDSVFNILSVYKSGKVMTDPNNPYATYDQFFSLAEAKDGKIWIGGKWGSLSIYDPVTQRFTNSKPKEFQGSTIVIMKTDAEGTVWIGLREGQVCRWDTARHSFVVYDSLPDPEKYVLRILQDMYIEDQTQIWRAREFCGLTLFDFSKNITETFIPHDSTNASGDVDSNVTCINRFDDSTLVIGTVNSGIYLFNLRSRIFRRLIPVNGLFDSYITAVSRPVNHKIWVASMSGLSLFDLPTSEIIHFSEEDGIITNSFNSLFLQDGKKLLIGNSHGFLSIDPSQLNTSQKHRNVKITGFSIMNHNINIDSFLTNHLQVTLSHDENYFSISFICPAYFEAHSFSYSYRLLGVDNEWHFPSGNPEVTYSGLESGRYIFEVRAVNAQHDDAPVTKIEIVVQAPFYLQAWFILLCVAGVCSTGLAFRLIYLKNKKSMERVRKKISSDLHDDIGSTLNSISVYSEIARRGVPSENASILPVIEKMGTASRNMIDNMNDIVWAVNPKNDQFENVMQRMQYFAGELLSSKNILLQFDGDQQLRKIKLPMEHRKNFYLIYKEAVNNAFKYSGCKTLNVSIGTEGNHLVMIITDDGCGFDELKPGMGGNGFRNMQERADEMNAKLEIKSWVNKGTRVSLKLKLH